MTPLAFGEGYVCVLPYHPTDFRANVHLSDGAGQTYYSSGELMPYLNPGLTYHFQYWYRIPWPASDSGHSMTHSISGVFGPAL